MDKILSLFGIENAVVKPLGEGLINDTYVVTASDGASAGGCEAGASGAAASECIQLRFWPAAPEEARPR